MDITERSGLDTLVLPLPLYTSVAIADAVKDDDRFVIVAGLDQKLAEELKKRSLDESDEAVQRETSDRKRFGEGLYEAWYAKDRTPFALVHEGTGSLAALTWFGPETYPGAPMGEWHTVAYRSYAPFRGKGIMKDFASFTMRKYREVRPDVKLWAAIRADNAASLALAEKLGFEGVSGEAGEPGSVVMVLS